MPLIMAEAASLIKNLILIKILDSADPDKMCHHNEPRQGGGEGLSYKTGLKKQKT